MIMVMAWVKAERTDCEHISYALVLGGLVSVGQGVIPKDKILLFPFQMENKGQINH